MHRVLSVPGPPAEAADIAHHHRSAVLRHGCRGASAARPGDRDKVLLGSVRVRGLLWTFGALPLAVTALLVPVLLVCSAYSLRQRLAPLLTVVFLLIGGLIIAEAFRANGLDRHIAYHR